MNNPRAIVRLPLDATLLQQVAPLQLPNYRQLRFAGDSLRVSLDSFQASDQEILQRLYQELTKLFALLKQYWHDDAATLAAVQHYLRDTDWSAMIHAMRSFGGASLECTPSPQLSRVVHDVRGGGFVALSIFLQLIDMGMSEEADVSRLFYLTRDHLKIMRNAIAGLDLAGEAHDSQEYHHDVDLIAEKWHQATHHVADTSATVLVECHYCGSISESCLEFAALDRILYNLINNAVRFAADKMVYLVIFPLDEAAETLRFVVYNRSGAEHLTKLQTQFEDDLGKLFLGGFTTGGSGIGLRICAEFVTNAFGLATVEQGLECGYFGATQFDDYFVSWVHWPTAGH